MLGYFKIKDLEQVYVGLLQETLCVSYAGKTLATEKGWIGTWGNFCSGSPDWGTGKENDPLRGGDWCSETNSAGGCRDSWRNETYFAFQAFPIRDDTCVPANVGVSAIASGGAAQ